MTTQELALLIVAAIFAQVAVYALVAFFRHWENYQALRQRVEALPEGFAPLPAAPAPPSDAETAGWEGWRAFRVTRKVYEDAERSICSFYLAPQDGQALPAFEPGQYLTFRFELTDPRGHAPRQIVRCYSLSTQPRPDYYRISVKRLPPAGPDAPPGLASNYLHDQVEEGSVLSVKAPSGHFHLAEGSPLPIVLVGGGIGITPMLGILDSLAHAGDTREVWLFYGARNGGEAIMLPHLRGLAAARPRFHLHLCYSRPGEQEVEGVEVVLNM